MADGLLHSDATKKKKSCWGKSMNRQDFNVSPCKEAATQSRVCVCGRVSPPCKCLVYHLSAASAVRCDDSQSESLTGQRRVKKKTELTKQRTCEAGQREAGVQLCSRRAAATASPLRAEWAGSHWDDWQLHQSAAAAAAAPGTFTPTEQKKNGKHLSGFFLNTAVLSTCTLGIFQKNMFFWPLFFFPKDSSFSGL